MDLLPQNQSPGPAQPESRPEAGKKIPVFFLYGTNEIIHPNEGLGAALTTRDQRAQTCEEVVLAG